MRILLIYCRFWKDRSGVLCITQARPSISSSSSAGRMLRIQDGASVVWWAGCCLLDAWSCSWSSAGLRSAALPLCYVAFPVSFKRSAYTTLSENCCRFFRTNAVRETNTPLLCFLISKQIAHSRQCCAVDRDVCRGSRCLSQRSRGL